ncbi:phage tail fiber protein [Rhodococcoides fascians]|uniref:phage tail fiber protein n=1 Tax=Rhodococcoides fascians TaxID=1828 RepID=UPI000690DA63|nr:MULTISPECIES: hypothetical protein [Rhodococcus]OZC50504.1 hypothetical protein CH289_15875 [Rhodococcus sp. RS1C4]OZD65164.1 hypothetical protein CH263_13565 [Rhodococcus sp. 06-1059B-a]OZE98066.1 hypothetical protein CH301_17120 [Rhodococcus sp. 15-1189-1-1a]OZF12716.1 hypothetical protein CH299_17805 [Rhodococcus sp. 14-2686-1-2]
MPLTPQTREDIAIYTGTIGTWISLHTADPGTSGANEATGGGYARKQTTWTGGAVDGTLAGSAVTIPVAAGTYAWAGIWSAQTGGRFVGSIPIASTQLGATGEIVVTPTVNATG